MSAPNVAALLASLPGRQVYRPHLAKHTVVPNRGGWFDVTSGNSGTTYKVVPAPTGAWATCPCVGAQRSPAPCSHVRACWEWADQQRQQQLQRGGK